MNADQQKQYRRRHQRVALIFSAVVAGMVGMSFAAVPLYRMFCAATGYAGTTQVAHVAPSEPGKRASRRSQRTRAARHRYSSRWTG